MRTRRIFISLYDGFVDGGFNFFRRLARRNSTGETRRKCTEELATRGYFGSVLEHDLYTPLSIMETELSSLMQMAKGRNQLEPIIIRLVNAISNIRDAIYVFTIANTDSVHFSEQTQVLRISDLLNSAIKQVKVEMKFDAEKMFLRFNHIKGDSLLNADARMLSEAFMLLLKNAMSAQNYVGVVDIRLSVDERNEKVTVEIQDNGCGMEPELIREVIDPSAVDCKYIGTRLRLAKLIVKLHSGQIGIQSNLGEGTTVSVSLPIHNSKTSANLGK